MTEARKRFIAIGIILVLLVVLTVGGGITGFGVYDLADALNIDTNPTITNNAQETIAISSLTDHKIKVSGGNGVITFQENSEIFDINQNGFLTFNEGTGTARYGTHALIVIAQDEDGDFTYKRLVLEVVG